MTTRGTKISEERRFQRWANYLYLHFSKACAHSEHGPEAENQGFYQDKGYYCDTEKPTKLLMIV